MMTLFFLGTGAGALTAGLAIGPWSLALGLTLIGLFASIYHPVGIAWLVGAGNRPGRALGFNGVFGAIGTAGAALIAGALTDLISWRAAFILPGLVCIATGLAFALCLQHGRVAMVRASYRQGTARHGAAAARRGLILLLGAMLFSGLIYQMTSVGMPKIFQARLGDEIGATALAAGSLVSLVYAISALGQVAAGSLADRFDERWLYALSYAIQIVILGLALASHDAALVVLVALAVTLQTGTGPIENCLLARYTPDAWRATVYGLKFVIALGLSALGVPLLALIYRLTGAFDGVFWTLIAFSAVPLLVALALPAARAAPAAAAAEAAD